MIYIGIDPGGSGGLCYIDSRTLEVSAVAMPDTLADIWDWFIPLVGQESFAVIEKVTGYVGKQKRKDVKLGDIYAVGDPGSAMFKFGTSYGALRAFLTSGCIPYEEIIPAVWQKSLGVPTRGQSEKRSDWKNRLKAQAQRLFPTVRVTLKTADSLLIAEYCRRKRKVL